MMISWLILNLVSNVVPGSLPQHVELPGVLQTEIIEDDRPDHQLCSSNFLQILKVTS